MCLHAHLANEHLRRPQARRAASHRLQPPGPVPGGDRARLADAVTCRRDPSAIGSCSVRALGSLGSRLLLSISAYLLTPCSRLEARREVCDLRLLLLCTFRRSFRLDLVCSSTLGLLYCELAY